MALVAQDAAVCIGKDCVTGKPDPTFLFLDLGLHLNPQIEQITPMNATPNWLEDVRRAEQIAAASPRGRPAAASAPTAHRNVTGREGPPPSVVGRYGDSVLIAAVVTAVLVVLGGLAFTGRYLLTTRTTTPEADKPIDNVSDVPATEISPRSR